MKPEDDKRRATPIPSRHFRRQSDMDRMIASAHHAYWNANVPGYRPPNYENSIDQKIDKNVLSFMRRAYEEWRYYEAHNLTPFSRFVTDLKCAFRNLVKCFVAEQ